MNTRHDEFVWGSLETVCRGFGFTEGPLWHPDGWLLFQDLSAATTLAFNPDVGLVDVRLETGAASGQTFDGDGLVVFCEGASPAHGGQRRVGRIEADGTVSTVADRWDGLRLNAPNDIVAHTDGSLFFTNPRHIIPDDDADIPHSAVYRIDPGGIVVETTAIMPLPNGLAFSPDESILYVANTRPEPKIFAYDVDRAGNLGNERLFLSIPVAPESPGWDSMLPDGIKVDVEGRLYVTAPGGVWVIDPSGGVRTILRTPEWVTNLTFGDEDGMTLFLTCRDQVCRVRTTTPGIRPPGEAGARPFVALTDEPPLA